MILTGPLFLTFRCPCENHKAYGLLFLFTPAILLLALSLLACQRSRVAITTMLLKHRNYKARCNYFLSSLVDFFRPFLALASWIVVVLLRGECYVCIRAGPGEKCLPAGEEVSKYGFCIRIFTFFSSLNGTLIFILN